MTGTDEKALLDKLRTGLFMGGEWRSSSDGSTIDVEDPATGQALTARARRAARSCGSPGGPEQIEEYLAVECVGLAL